MKKAVNAFRLPKIGWNALKCGLARLEFHLGSSIGSRISFIGAKKNRVSLKDET